MKTKIMVILSMLLIPFTVMADGTTFNVSEKVVRQLIKEHLVKRGEYICGKLDYYYDLDEINGSCGYSVENKNRHVRIEMDSICCRDSLSIKVGDIATIKEWEWIKTVRDNSCRMERGGTIEVEYIKEDRILVSYLSPNIKRKVACMFYLSKKEYLSLKGWLKIK